jgi:hypothetical protein
VRFLKRADPGFDFDYMEFVGPEFGMSDVREFLAYLTPAG